MGGGVCIPALGQVDAGVRSVLLRVRHVEQALGVHTREQLIHVLPEGGAVLLLVSRTFDCSIAEFPA
jgi:hypothetical protein